ncbi:hypothetical protein F5Y19DRAFT_162011 [Xylariaceae sp. FL1651]|nr:hypothetical protein F5Y19DRAFT_162011 [Xylariaceae sp. FL1651]
MSLSNGQDPSFKRYSYLVVFASHYSIPNRRSKHKRELTLYIPVLVMSLLIKGSPYWFIDRSLQRISWISHPCTSSHRAHPQLSSVELGGKLSGRCSKPKIRNISESQYSPRPGRCLSGRIVIAANHGSQTRSQSGQCQPLLHLTNLPNAHHTLQKEWLSSFKCAILPSESTAFALSYNTTPSWLPNEHA